jgi:hypothetical protein
MAEPDGVIKKLSDSSSPFHSRLKTWQLIQEDSNSDLALISPRRAPGPASVMPEDSALVGRDWGKWLEQEQAVSTGAVRRQLTRTLSKQSNLVQSHVSHLGKTQTRRDIFTPTFSNPEEGHIVDNLSTLKVALDEVTDTWRKNDKEEAFLEGRILAVINNSGRIADWSYHILPTTVSAGETKPDLFSDAVFESWWKSSEVWKEMVRANSTLKEFSQIFCPPPQKRASQKFPTGTLEAIGQLSEEVSNANLVEFILALSEEGEFSWCMVALYDDIGLPVLTRDQNRVILETINRLNANSTTTFRKRERGMDYRPRRGLGGFRMSSVIVTPLLFQFLEWSHSQKKISHILFSRKTKHNMAMALPYLIALHEHAMSPLNLGLRALMLPPQPALANSKLKG